MLKLVFSLFLTVVVFLSYAQSDHVGSGRCLELDGVDDYVDLGDIYDDLVLPVTIEAWVKIGSQVDYVFPIFATQDNLSRYSGVNFHVLPTQMSVGYGDGRGANNPIYRRGKSVDFPSIADRWTHVAATMRSATSMDLYINGVNVGGTYQGTSTYPMNSKFSDEVAKIGYWLSNLGYYNFKGQMDELRFWNRSLTEAEIRTNMCKKLLGTEAGLIGYWQFDEISGDVAEDKSSFGYDGVYKGNPSRPFSGAPVGDESIYIYPTSWTSTSLTYTQDDDTLTVSSVTGAPAGMHIYKVDSLPSQTQGLDVTTVQQPYFGVFGGRNNAAYGYTVAYSYKGKNPCGIYSRQDNSVSTWSARTAFQFSAPAELIRKGVGVVFDLGPDKALCDQPSATLATGITDPAVSFLWSTGESTADIQVTETGDYWVDVSDNCSTKRDKIHIDFQATPANVNLGADEMLCNVASKTLKPTAQTEDMTFTWQDGSTDAQFVVRDFGVYWVSVSNSCGVVSDTITISKKIYTLEGVPNVITPNGDAQNEHFRIPSEQSVGVIRLAVYNRWGMRVFFSSDYKNDWNGSGLSAGMYFYRLSGGCIADAKGALTILE